MRLPKQWSTEGHDDRFSHSLIGIDFAEVLVGKAGAQRADGVTQVLVGLGG